MTEDGKRDYKSVHKTRKSLADSLLKLAKEKPLDKITVTEICNEADISRNAYYAHYEGLYSQVETLEGFAVNAAMEAVTGMVAQPTRAEYVSKMKNLADEVLQWRVIAELILNTSAITHFVYRLKAVLSPLMLQLAEKLHPQYDETQQLYYKEMVIDGMIAMFRVFLREDEPDSARFAEFSARLVF